jgi:WD40 repeat protein
MMYKCIFKRTKKLTIDSADDSKRFASCSGDKQVFIWDVTTGVPLRKLRDHKGVRVPSYSITNIESQLHIV